MTNCICRLRTNISRLYGTMSLDLYLCPRRCRGLTSGLCCQPMPGRKIDGIGIVQALYNSVRGRHGRVAWTRLARYIVCSFSGDGSPIGGNRRLPKSLAADSYSPMASRVISSGMPASSGLATRRPSSRDGGRLLSLVPSPPLPVVGSLRQVGEESAFGIALPPLPRSGRHVRLYEPPVGLRMAPLEDPDKALKRFLLTGRVVSQGPGCPAPPLRSAPRAPPRPIWRMRRC